VTRLQDDNSVVFYYMKSGLIRWMAFGVSDLIREGLLYLELFFFNKSTYLVCRGRNLILTILPKTS